MKLEGGQISTGQIVFLASSFCLGATLLRTPAAVVGHTDWLAILLGLIEGLFIVCLFTALNIKFPGKNLVEILKQVFGPLLGSVVSLAYVFYFFLLATMTLRLFGDFFSGIIFPQTPIVVIIGVMVLVCASAVRNGIEVIARCSQVLLPLAVLTIIITIVLSLPDMKFAHFLPFIDVPLGELFKISYYTATSPFGESIVFLMFMAYLSKQQQTTNKGRSALISGLTLGTFFLVLISVRNTGLLGDTKVISTYSSYQATRLIDIADILTRVEIIASINFLTMGFLVISLFYYSSVLAMAQIFKLRTYLPLVLPIGILLACISITQFENVMEYQRFSEEFIPVFALPLQIGIPIICLLISKLKKKPKSGGR
ncbi:MAG: endospore germination permease [Clostridia bacterium]|nr:endospore germination permease [Clostridia bacterium]